VERSRTIWNGLEPLAAPPPREAVAALRARLGLEAQHVLVTLAGRINRGKGQDMFVDAARRLRAQGHHQLRYLIVGDVAAGQDALREAMLRQIQHAGLAGVVLWHPFTPEIDVVWAASDIAAVPSTGPESFGRVAIEAMAHGLPVVAAAQGGLAEIIVPDRTGLLVPPGDSAALAGAIGRLAGDVPLRQRLGEAGRQRQRERFSQEGHDRRLLAVVERLVGVGVGAAGPSGRLRDTAG
jgi:glycosyltransferase involved in cell wall biosynthesis